MNPQHAVDVQFLWNFMWDRNRQYFLTPKSVDDNKCLNQNIVQL